MKIRDWVENHFVSIDRFNPVEKLAYGLAGLILAGVVVALIGLVLK